MFGISQNSFLTFSTSKFEKSFFLAISSSVLFSKPSNPHEIELNFVKAFAKTSFINSLFMVASIP